MIHDLYIYLLNLIGLGFNPKGFSAVSGIFTVAAVFSIIIVGFIMNGLERLQMNLFQKIFNAKIATFICNYLTIAGTVVHECAHALFAILSGAKVTEISFYDKDDDTLGHINYITNGPFFLEAIQHTLIACAPVIVGLVAEYFLFKAIFYGHYSIWINILLWYLVVSIIDHMSMSDIDCKHYFQGMWVVAPLIFGGFFAYGYYFL